MLLQLSRIFSNHILFRLIKTFYWTALLITKQRPCLRCFRFCLQKFCKNLTVSLGKNVLMNISIIAILGRSLRPQRQTPPSAQKSFSIKLELFQLDKLVVIQGMIEGMIHGVIHMVSVQVLAKVSATQQFALWSNDSF